jgi:TRAP-type C4-dicarboxylate transport system permease small subunit
MLDRLRAANRRLNAVLMFLAGILLGGMVLLSCSNIVLRAFWVPIKGTFEFMGFGGAMVAALALAGTQQSKGHITVTLIPENIAPFWNRMLILLSNLLSLGLFVIMAWQVLELALALKDMGELSETMRLPYYPVVIVVALGIAALGLGLAVEIVSVFFPDRRRRA